MSAKFKRVKSWYDNALEGERHLRDAVAKGWITSGEYEAITGTSAGDIPVQPPLEARVATIEETIDVLFGGGI